MQLVILTPIRILFALLHLEAVCTHNAPMHDEIRRKQAHSGKKRHRVYTYLSEADNKLLRDALKKEGISRSYFLAEAIREKAQRILGK